MISKSTFFKAVCKDDVVTVSELLLQGLPISITNSQGESALHLAAYHGSVRTMPLLLRRGFELNAKTLNGDSPLHYAAMSGNLACLDLLLKAGANYEARNKLRQTPLHEAARHGFPNVVALLLQYDAHSDCLDERGQKPLDIVRQKIAMLTEEAGNLDKKLNFMQCYKFLNNAILARSVEFSEETPPFPVSSTERSRKVPFSSVLRRIFSPAPRVAH